ncbi:uncharacterized protein LOC132281886 [Cornus florida]|uniref:uncharacterized protein LOC132281886 n=1 Tax=Cornus florida TaxID=4283 RepID=UPI00289B9E1A|nr:uncharacterized protein LOC132281886 [Cornus florida]
MFQTSVLEVGKSGKSYGMAQCTRDLSIFECGKCLNTSLVNSEDNIKSNREWEIFQKGCSMWYHDYQFYNISTTVSAGARKSEHGVVARKSEHGVVVGILAFLMFTYLVVLYSFN